ncbi:MAG: DUF4431 domain-containing protein [Deltaproteobacteria bacterium]|nr:DUF4431 domain-containing protein [Deltaproteobacteria bacterium]
MKLAHLLLCLLVFFVFAVATNGMGAEPLQADENYKSTIDEVELTGKLTAETFSGAKGKTGREIMLNLAAPVNVDKDETHGPTKNVSKIQVALFNGRIKSRIRKLINKKVRIKGILFYGNRPSHHTVVLMDVKDVARAGR